MQKKAYQEMAEVEDSHWYFLGKRLFVESVISTLNIKKKLGILDIGCGTGAMTATLGVWGKAKGVDTNKYALAHAKKRGLDVRYASANHLPFPDESFDMITLFDVLYHKNIKEKQALAEARRVLKRGGFLIIHDCAHPVLWTKHDEVMQARCRYTKIQLMTEIRQAGFQVERSTYTFVFTFPFFVAQRILAKITNRYFPLNSTPVWINRVLSAVVSVESRLIRRNNFPIGSSLLVVARK